MVMNRGMSDEIAAKWSALFYLGITVGRFICGFISMKLDDKTMIRLGQRIIVGGIILLMLPLGNLVMCLGFIMIGLGCAPIYPSIIHSTPSNFGAGVSQAMIGMQMACAYVGITLMPPLFGALAEWVGIGLYPLYLLLITIFMILMLEKLNGIIKRKQEEKPQQL